MFSSWMEGELQKLFNNYTLIFSNFIGWDMDRKIRFKNTRNDVIAVPITLIKK